MSDPKKCRDGLRRVSLVLGFIAMACGSGCAGPIALQLALEIPKQALMKAYRERELSKSCSDMHGVERALSERCGEYVPGRLAAADVNRAAPEECPLTVATAEPRRWRMLPELVDKGARAERCTTAPLTALMQQPATRLDAALRSATKPQIDALAWIADHDERAIQPAVVQWLSSPAARDAGLDKVLLAWADKGLLDPRKAGFEPLAWLHPSALSTPLPTAFMVRGQRAETAIRSNPGALEEALRAGDLAALDWWFARVPGLANLVADNRELRVNWRPLAYVATPGVIPDAKLRQTLTRHLLSRGADPSATLPHQPGVTVLAQAQRMSPDLAPVMQASLTTTRQATLAVTRPSAVAPEAAAAVSFPLR
jgi:hypothetical protein